MVSILDGSTFLVCDRRGDVDASPNAPQGFFFRDTRFLSHYELLIDGLRPTYLHSEVDRNYSMLIETTLPVTSVDPSGVETGKNISISRHRWLEHGMHETIKVQNFGSQARCFPSTYRTLMPSLVTVT